MTLRTHVVRRSGSSNYYFRVQIPTDLRAHYGKKEVWRSLRTSDLRKANELGALETVKQEQEFADVRRQLYPQPINELTDLEIERLGLLMSYRALDVQERLQFNGLASLDYFPGEEPDPSKPFDGHSKHDMARLTDLTKRMLDMRRDDLAHGRWRTMAGPAKSLLAEHGMALSPDQPSFKKLCIHLLKSLIKTIEQSQERLGGAVFPSPVQPPPFDIRKAEQPAHTSTQESDQLTAMAVFKLWTEEKRTVGTVKKTLDDFRTAFIRFTQLHGDLPVTAITKDHIRQYKDAMLKMPRERSGDQRKLTVPAILKACADDPNVRRISPKTVKDKLVGALRAVLGWAVDNGYIDTNPADGIRIAAPKVTGKSRLPYSSEDLNQIFQFPVFTQGERPRAGAGEAAKWLPLLALYTGARLEELGQLTVSDVQDTGAFPYLDLNANDGKSLKTDGSRRNVPLHPELVRLGFLEYVKERREAGDRWVFPKLDFTADRCTGSWSKWWGRYVRQHGITDKRKVFHSFRHTVKDAFREAKVPKEYSDAIQGHSSGDVSSKYGTGYSVGVLAEYMAKIRYPGLDLGALVCQP